TAVTVRVLGAPAPDVAYAVELARRLRLSHHILSVSRPALMRALVPTIRILKSFDPMEIRNSVAAYLGLREARRLGIRSVYTGDGGDEVFCGYSFLFGKYSAELKTYQKRLFGFMRFSSVPLGRALGVRVESPFLDRGLMRMALKLPRRWLIQKRHGTPIGKWAVRKALEGDLPDRFVWRENLPIEYGSGTTILRRWLAEPADRRAFARAKPAVLKRDGIRLRDPEQWHYYTIYCRLFGPPKPARAGVPACVACHSCLSHPESRFCTTCGEWPATESHPEGRATTS
ncbi:MAG: asparagine synthase-related protein, partial [bacterium]